MSRRILTQAPNPHTAPPVSAATRRDLFGAMGALLLLTATEAGAAKASELDGNLFADCAEAMAIDRESDRLFKHAVAVAADAPGSHPAWVAHDDFENANQSRWHDLVKQIAGTPARTPEGLRAKAAMARSAIHGESLDNPDPMDVLAWSVFDDVLGRAGA